MCVAAIAWDIHPQLLLVAIGNRDEYHARPATPLARWNDGSGIIAGRDLQSGGTWLGVSEEGRFALVTNRRGFGPPDPVKASRGALVSGLLTAKGAYADPEAAALDAFNPFNLFFASRGRAMILANRPETIRAGLVTGIYGLSNGALDEPWPKTLQLKAALMNWLGEEDRNPETLFTPLRNETLEPIGVASSQPSDIPQEAPQTPIFIRNPVYGTRCSTIVAIDREGNGSIIERRFDAHGQATGDTKVSFAWKI